MRNHRTRIVLVVGACLIGLAMTPAHGEGERKAPASASTSSKKKPTSKQDKKARPQPQASTAPRIAQAPSVAAQRQPPPQIPSPTQLTLLLQQTMAALGQANITGNYTVLHALSAPTFQKLNSPDRLAQIFSVVRAKIDITPVILYQPVLTNAPQLNDKGLLRLVGYYATSPSNITFDVSFVVHAGMWRLEAISIGTRPVQSVGLSSLGAQ